MAVPKKRTSRSRKKNRRSHDKLKVPTFTVDPETGETRRPHHMSPEGVYNGRQIVEVEEV